MTLAGFFEGTGMPDPGWWEALWPDPAGVLTAAGLKPSMTAVDLCSGDGWFTLPIARFASEVWGIDIDAALLKTAQARLAEAQISNCTFIEGDAYAISGLIPEKVDFVFLANAFHGVPDKPRLSKAVQAALKPDGLFVVVNWHARPREETIVLGEPRGPATQLRMTPEETCQAIGPAGFTRTACVPASPYHYAAVFQRSKPHA